MFAIALKVPPLGEGVHAAVLQTWLKQPGEYLEVGEPFVELATDKVDNEVPSTISGVLQQLCVPAGQRVQVGEIIAYASLKTETTVTAPTKHAEAGASDKENDKNDEPPPSFTPTAITEVPCFTSTDTTTQHLPIPVRTISPYVRSLIHQHGLSAEDFAQIPGSGTGNRVTGEDIEKWLTHRTQPLTTPTHVEGQAKKGPLVGETFEGVPVIRKPLSTARQTIARNILRTLSQVPHVTTSLQVDFSHVMALKSRMHGDHITVSSFVAYAVVQTLKEYPQCNAYCDGNDILWRQDIHLGCAVATGHGELVIPVVKDAHTMDFLSLAAALHGSIERARTGKLQAHELVGGTFTFSNPARYGCEHSTAIIHRGQSAILTIGRTLPSWQPVYDSSQQPAPPTPPAILPCANIKGWQQHLISSCGLTFDHRLLDGKDAGLFLSHFKSLMEECDLHY